MWETVCSYSTQFILCYDPSQGHHTLFSNPCYSLTSCCNRIIFRNGNFLHKPKQHNTLQKILLVRMNGHLHQKSNHEKQLITWKPGCDIHEEWKCLEFIQHFSCAVRRSSLRQAGVGIIAHVTYRETDALEFKCVRPLEKQNSQGLMVTYGCLMPYSSDIKIKRKKILVKTDWKSM